MTDSSAPSAVATRLVQALARGDLNGVLAEVSEEFTLEMPAAPRGAKPMIRGREEIATLVGHVGTTWKRVGLTRFEVHPLADDPTRVLAEYALEGTNLDDSTYRNDYVTVITVNDGKATRLLEFFDPAPITQALDALRAHLRATRTG